MNKLNINAMDNLKLKELIREYKKDFNDIIPNEIYKWKAVKCFQDKVLSG